MVRRIVFMFMVFLFTFSLNAQEIDGVTISPEFSQRVNVIYSMEFEEDFFAVVQRAGLFSWGNLRNNSLPIRKEVWQRAFEATIGSSEQIAQIMRSVESIDILTQAKENRFPLIVNIYVSVDFEEAVIHTKYIFKGLFSDTFIFENSYEVEIPQEVNILSYLWLQLATDLENFIKNVIIIPPILVRAPSGTRLYGFSPEPITIPETEYIFIFVPVPGTYKWTMVHENYVNQTGIFMADRDNLVLTFSREKKFFAVRSKNLDLTESSSNLYVEINHSSIIPQLLNKPMFPFGATIRLGAAPFNFLGGNIGFSMTINWNRFSTELYDSSVNNIGAQFNVIYMKYLNENMVLSFHSGAGMAMLMNYDPNTDDSEYMLFHQLGFGFSLRYYLFKSLFMSAGMDYIYWFTNDENEQGYIRPWMGIGWRF